MTNSLTLQFGYSTTQSIVRMCPSSDVLFAQFQKDLVSMRNFRPAFIDGTTNVRLSTVKDHAGTDMHARPVLLHKKQRSSVCEYAPITRSLSQLSMDAITRDRTKRKIDVAYMIAKEVGLYEDGPYLQ